MLPLPSLPTIILFVLLGWLYFKYSFSYWNRKGLPQLSPNFPLGNFSDLLRLKRSFGVHFRNMYDELKLFGEPLGGIYFCTKPLLMPLRPEVLKDILIKNFHCFADRGTYSNEDIDPLSGHLFNLTGQKWKNMRNKLTPAFTSGKMKMMFPLVVRCGQELEQVLGEAAEAKTVLDIKEYAARFTTDVIGTCAFGIECRSLQDPNVEFRQYGKKIFHWTPSHVVKRCIGFFFPELLQLFNLRVLQKDLSTFFSNIVKSTVEYREGNSVDRKDFLQLLIKLKNNQTIGEEPDDSVQDSSTLSMDEIAAQTFLFFAAGFETSSTTMAFCMYELAVNPDIQDRVREEIRDVMERNGGELSYDSLDELVYMEKVVRETLRKYPALPILNRKCIQNCTLQNGDFTVMKGTHLVVPVYGIHHDPDYYPDPEKFDPERFTKEEIARREDCVYLPFGEGPRNCVGLRFARMQVKVGLVHMLKDYRYSLNARTISPLEMSNLSLVLSAHGDIWLKATKTKEM